MSVASVRLGLRYETIRAAKNANAPGFNTNNSVNCDLLAAWYQKNPDFITIFEKLPNVAEEEALKTQAERRNVEVTLYKKLDAIVQFSHCRRALTSTGKIFSGRVSAMRDRLHLKFNIPKADLDLEIAAILQPLDPAEFETLFADVARNSK